MAEIAYLGIRHHGPGSARRVLSRLDALRPGKVLIEGPADLTDQLPHLAHPKMIPPVALLAYSEKQPESAVFWPFAEYSPEYQAAVWAIRHGVELAFIDLPVAQRFDPSEATTGDEETSCEDNDPAPPEPVPVAPQNHDPFTILGQLLGYEDGESFWNDFFETEGGEDAFDAIDTAIEALREAAIACLSFGEVLPWREIETQLLLGSDVGHVPADLSLAPLLEDLTRQQKKAKLKPQALEKELSLDLRTSSGLTRSTLLHRLNALDVPWG
jgi:hypothetical protein